MNRKERYGLLAPYAEAYRQFKAPLRKLSDKELNRLYIASVSMAPDCYSECYDVVVALMIEIRAEWSERARQSVKFEKDGNVVVYPIDWTDISGPPVTKEEATNGDTVQ